MKCSIFRFVLAGLLAVGLSSASHATILLNEIFVNPPGTDNGQEFIELKSSTGGIESMTGLTLLVIEGDGANPGLIDVALPLSSFSTGTNGLFLWRDAASVISPAPNAATTLNIADFNPDIENGSNTFLIVSGFTGTAGLSDIDTLNNGMVDAIFWSSVIDGLGFIENDGVQNVAYGAALGFLNFGPDAGFNADVLVRLENGIWFGSDVTGTSPGPYDFDPARAAFQNGAPANLGTFDITTATPGNTNPTATPVPEPSTFALLGLGFAGLALYRRQRA